MAIIKRHWRAVVLCSFFISCLIGWGLYEIVFFPVSSLADSPSGATGGEGDDGKLDVVTYCDVEALRGELCLRNENLAAMGCSGERTQLVLTALLEWYKANQKGLADADAAMASARGALREALRRVNKGPQDETLLNRIPALKKAIPAALAERQTLIDTFAAKAQATLSQDQAVVWACIRANASAPHRYRVVPGLTDALRKKLTDTLRLYNIRMAVAGDEEKAQEAAEEFETGVSEVLSASQKQALALAQTNQNTYMAQVIEAGEKILPIPEEYLEKMDAGIDTGGTEP